MVIFFGRGPRQFNAQCGHKTPAEGEVKAFGDAITMVMPRNLKKKHTMCPSCLAKKAICCAWCGQAIFVGEPVTLFVATAGGVEPKPDSMLHGGDRLVGCLRPKCKQPNVSAVGILSLNVTTGTTYIGEIETGSQAREAAQKASRFAAK
jgi:hypothetical protein